MLNRKQVEARTSEIPSVREMVRKACKNLRKTVPAEFQDGLTDNELRLRFTEEAALSWMESHSDRDDQLGGFLRLLGFDWADVRELKGVQFDAETAQYREELLQEVAPTNVEDARSAMQLIERWFKTAVQDYGDCVEEFILAHSLMMHSIDSVKVDSEAALKARWAKALLDISRGSIMVQWLLGFAFIFTNSTLLHHAFMALVAVNGIILFILIPITFSARRRVEMLCYFKPSQRLSGKKQSATRG